MDATKKLVPIYKEHTTRIRKKVIMVKSVNKISKFKLDLKDNDKKIMVEAKFIYRLQKDLESKEIEIKETDSIINIIKYNYLSV